MSPRYNSNTIGEKFREGETSGWISGKNMQITEITDGVTALLSYAAVIAVRDEPRQRFIVFDGWRGYSPTTSTHMGKALSRRHDDDHNPTHDYALHCGYAYIESDDAPMISNHVHRGDYGVDELKDRLEGDEWPYGTEVVA